MGVVAPGLRHGPEREQEQQHRTDEEPQRAERRRDVDEGTSTDVSVAGTTYAATAAAPNATQPQRFTSRRGAVERARRAAQQAVRDRDVGHVAGDEEADRAERVGAPYEPVVGGGADRGGERTERGDVEEQRADQLDAAAPPVEPARLPGEPAQRRETRAPASGGRRSWSAATAGPRRW